MRVAPCAPSSSRLHPPSVRRGAHACAALVAATIFLSIAGDSTARAQDAYGCIDRLPDAAVRYRLKHVHDELMDARRVEMPWWVGWMTFNGVSAAVAWVGLALTDQRVVRDTWLVNAVGSSFFVVPEAIIPLPGLYTRRRLRRLPESTPEERRVKLRKATELLEKSAVLTSSQRGPAAHIGGWGYAAASTAYVAIRNQNPTRARKISLTVQFTTTVVFAEITILSVPRRSERAWEDYRYFACSDPWMGAPEELPEDLREDALPPPPVTTRAPRRPPVFFGFGFGSISVAGTF